MRPPSSTGLFIGAEPNTIRSGHEDQFLPRRPNARYRFRLRTFAGTSANGRDAPKAVISERDRNRSASRRNLRSASMPDRSLHRDRRYARLFCKPFTHSPSSRRRDLGRGVIVEATGKLGKIGDNEITSRIWYRVGRTGWTPFSGTTDKCGPITFPAGRI